MEFINQIGRHVRIGCERCDRDVWVPAAEMRLNPGPVTCSDCQQYLQRNPDVAEREFQQALRRSEDDSRQMRARWAAQDAEKQGRAS